MNKMIVLVLVAGLLGYLFRKISMKNEELKAPVRKNKDMLIRLIKMRFMGVYPYSVAEIARASGYSKSTVYRNIRRLK